MERGASGDERYMTLLATTLDLDGPDERRAFLEVVCQDEPELLADIMKTITVDQKKDDAQTSRAAGESHSLFEAGQVVAGRFHIVRELGEGGMAVVYEAVDSKLIERRALKFSKAGYSQSIPPEARSALRVTHENICRVYEIHATATESGPADFLSMEFLDGETLLNRWQREAIPGSLAIDIARQICRGLEAAHSAGILHRDLKSNNVMLVKRADGSLRAVITDFGLARPLSHRTGPASSAVSGTPNYIAPERWKGGTATPASDVYALGVILYEMLAGSLPFAHGTPWQKRLSGLPEPPSRSERAPDARWDGIVLGCLDPDPRKRFSSAHQVLEAIEQAFHVSSRRKWLAAAGVGVLAAGSLFLLRDRVWPPPPLARLAVLSFTGSSTDPGIDQAVQGGLHDLGARLASLGSASRRLVVIPLEESLRYDVNAPAKAVRRLGATHTLSGALGRHGSAVTVRAVVTELSSGAVVREFSGEFPAGDLSFLSTAVPAVVSSAFHLDRAPPASVRPTAYTHYAAGLASLHRSSSEYEAAAASFEEAMKLDNRSPLIHAGVAQVFLRKFRATNDARWLKEASAFARRAESLHPDSAPVLLALASVERAEGRLERAVELYRRAAELEPANPEAWRQTGIAFHQIGREVEATAALRKAIQLAPDYFAPHLSLGAVHFRMGRHTEAIEEFSAVTRLAPELPEGHSYLGGALLAAEREREAEQALRRSIALRETRSALNNLGVLLRYQGRDREAVVVLERALQAGADDSGLRLNLAGALRRTGRLREARQNFERASELARAALRRNPRDAIARARLAYSMVRLGIPALAADEALQAARLAPSDYAVLFWSVLTLESLGRRDDAFPLLAHATYEQLRDLRRQPDLAGFAKDPRFTAALRQLQTSPTQQERTRENGRSRH